MSVEEVAVRIAVSPPTCLVAKANHRHRNEQSLARLPYPWVSKVAWCVRSRLPFKLEYTHARNHRFSALPDFVAVLG